jgi:1-acyl-sn-glycerol-3-phosphate acyltransferase
MTPTDPRSTSARPRQRFARWLLGLLGWRVEATLPAVPKYVVIGAPHTSNWDFPYGVLAMWAIGFRYRWIGKHTLFRWPFGGLMRALGGIPVDRRARHNFIGQMREIFAREPELVLIITPEGTRRRTEHWKSGFYYIARAAQVPIALGFIDYRGKRIGVGPSFTPSGDIAADMAVIRAFYADKIGRYPAHQGEIRILPRPPGDGGAA